MWLKTKLRQLVRDESGNSESALVLIPLLSLFLVVSQMTIAIHSRNMTKMNTQDQASSRALSGSFEDGDTFLHIHSPDKHQNLDLVISHSRKSILSIFPVIQDVIGGSQKIDVTGIALVENQR
ncbi:MAG: hypothetical protein NTY85_05340 [Actinobacteria bacterium]|nr:hypothetical protein [Actinomycetota bacterium]